jgi:signal peptidase I
MELPNFAQSLSDVHIVSIAQFAAVLTILRLGFIKVPSQLVRILVEIVEVILVVGIVIFVLFQTFIIKPFLIPSGSMRPTLAVNDRILVNRFLYRFQSPRHGDVVVFNAPQQALEQSMENTTSGEQIDYIKRLIGLPGDLLQVVGGTITVNGMVYHHDVVRSAFGFSAYDSASRDNQHIKFVDNGVDVFDGQRWTFYSAQDVAQRITGTPDAQVSVSPGYVLRNGKKLDEPYIAEDPDYDLKLAANGDVVLRDPDGIHVNGALNIDDPQEIVRLEKAPPAKVPQGDIIVMGDNRNDSNDSSRWGPLQENRLVGKAFYIFSPTARVRPIH